MARPNDLRHDRPDKEDLINKCRECITQKATAEWYGVDPKTLRRWLAFYGHPIKWKGGRPRNGYSKLELTQATLRKTLGWLEENIYMIADPDLNNLIKEIKERLS